MGKEPRREPGALVGDREIDPSVHDTSIEPDGARSVAESVVDEVSEGLLESYLVARQRRGDRRRDLDRAAACTRTCTVAPGDGLEELTDVVTLHSQFHAPVVRAREGQ